MARTRAGTDDTVRITTAAGSRAAEIRSRQKRYLLSMSLRTLCFVGAVIASLSGVDWLWPILVAGAIVLPYIAVVMANAAANLSDGFRLREGDFTRPELGASTRRDREL
ncbi:DUF3099 domain-containing protein [Nocardioides dongxiaopingii]|jgi:hypothetical protein|uniref:DUF3099 domain-containing protein n=1 Tax=Nocardioides TaxID=1839 RepID=UPI0010C7627E|nr:MULTISPECIES: DUF3099 domain-containing protein [Nocardioides]QCW50658.1 DUF3099 domain-containing protein [Nocardioides sp. S-1144]